MSFEAEIGAGTIVCASDESTHIRKFGKARSTRCLWELLLSLALTFSAAADERGHRAALKCPAYDFAKFSREFTESVDVQKAFTKYPLLRTWLVDGPLEPVEERGYFEESKLEFPIIPNAAERLRDGLRMDVTDRTSASAKLMVWIDDTDAMIIYHFEKHGCWYLTKKENQSL